MSDNLRDLKMSAKLLVKTAREKIGLSQDELADLIGLKEGSKVSRIEKGTRKPSGAEIVAFIVYKLLEPPRSGDAKLVVMPEEIVKVLRSVPQERRSIITAALALERFAVIRGRGEAVDKTVGVKFSGSMADSDNDEKGASVLGLKDHVNDLKQTVSVRGEQVGGKAQDRYDRAASLFAEIAEILDQAEREENRNQRDEGA